MRTVKAFTMLEVMVTLVITTIVFALGSQAMIHLVGNSDALSNIGAKRNSYLTLHTALEHHFLHAEEVQRTEEGLLFIYGQDRLEWVLETEQCQFYRNGLEIETFNIPVQILSSEREGQKVTALQVRAGSEHIQTWWFYKTYSLQQLNAL